MNRCNWLLVLSVVLASAGCSGTDASGGIVLSTPCTDAVDLIYAAPGVLPDTKGQVIRCAQDSTLTLDQMQARLAAVGYVGKPAASGANVYRVLYRTERGNGVASASSALLYLPDTPLAQKLPVVVASHGSRGQAEKCAPSRHDPAGAYVADDFDRQVLPIVAAGFAVIAPDLAGYSNFGGTDNPPSVYASAPDVARSTLDGARALRLLIPTNVTDQVVLVGHSQGGHTALSALASAGTYAPELNIATVVTYAPLWLSQRTWGALFLLASQYKIADSPTPNAVSIWYHYTQAELYDGPGEGAKLFQADKQAAVKKFIDEDCWAASYPTLEEAGTTILDLVDVDFRNTIMLPAAGQPCGTDEPAATVCKRWTARYVGDRPHLTGATAQVPLLVMYGGKDTTIVPERFQCALDRLKTDAAATTFCFDPAAGHSDLPALHGDYAADWIANKTLGLPITATCPSDKIELKDDKGVQVVCASPPPND